jgi:hypothetical protein
VACARSVGSTTEAEEPLEPPTCIPLPIAGPPITFTVSEPPRIVLAPRPAGGSVSSNTPRGQSGVAERVSRRRRAWLVICAALALALPVFVAQFWNLDSSDPLSEFSAISGTSTPDAQIEDWSRQQFAASDGLETTARIVRAKTALEQRMAAAIARNAGRPMDWSQVAAWANIARALGVHDNDMLELAADLNVQLAIYQPKIPEVDGTERLARARKLLRLRREIARDSSEVIRIERKLSDLDEIEFTIREFRGGRQ